MPFCTAGMGLMGHVTNLKEQMFLDAKTLPAVQQVQAAGLLVGGPHAESGALSPLKSFQLNDCLLTQALQYLGVHPGEAVRLQAGVLLRLRVSKAAWRSFFFRLSSCSWNTGFFRSSLTSASRLAMAKARQGVLQPRIGWPMADGPVHRHLRVCCSRGFVQPALIVCNDGRGANNPDTGFAFFHQHMAAGVLLAQGNLPVAANELQRGGVGCGEVNCGVHGQTR